MKLLNLLMSSHCLVTCEVENGIISFQTKYKIFEGRFSTQWQLSIYLLSTCLSSGSFDSQDFYKTSIIILNASLAKEIE